MIRTGLIMKKIGMTRLFSDNGKHIPVTVLLLDNNQVLFHRNEEKDGYIAMQIGAGLKKRPNKSLTMKYEKLGISPKQKVVEFRVTQDALVDVRSELSVEHFLIDQYVDVIGISLGKGFAGGIKRHNFSGLRASHGVSISHRSIGSTGNRTDPGRTFKNKKMPGHMGAKRVTIQNLKVVKIDSEKNIIYIKGGIPGHSNSWVIIRDAKKKKLPGNVSKASIKPQLNSEEVNLVNLES